MATSKYYYIYEKGTYKNSRAKYYGRSKTKWCNECDADRFTEAEKNAIMAKRADKYDFYPA